MEISRFLDASTIFDQSSLWGRHSEVLVIYPESCCILFCWLILANKKVEFDPWHLEFDRAKIGLLDSTLWGRVSKNNLSDFQTSFPGTWISKNESYQENLNKPSSTHFPNGSVAIFGPPRWSRRASKMPPAVESIISVAKAAPPTFSLRHREDTHHFQVRRKGRQKHPKQKNSDNTSSGCADELHFLLNMKDVRWWRDPINIRWKHFARRPAQYCRSPAPCRCCRIGIWDPTSASASQTKNLKTQHRTE